MKLGVASYHLPDPEGSAAGRQLWALCSAWFDAGHDVEALCWGPRSTGTSAPTWCRWEPVPPDRGWRAKPRTLLRPRQDVSRAAWRPPPDAVGWADDWASWPLVAQTRMSAVTVHYDVGLDARALGWSLPRVQDWRAQRRAVHRAGTAMSLSPRVAHASGARAVVPATLPVPDEPVPLVDRPVALLLADWRWPANQVALDRLLRDWPQVRGEVTGAELVVAGRGRVDVGSLAGVRVVGEVARAADVMAEAAVLAFPCPPTSGPKMKVLEAMAAGLPVVTTTAGVEGLRAPSDAVAVAEPPSYARALADVLRDASRRAAMSGAARAAVLAHHAPHAAAQARLELLGQPRTRT